MANSAQIGVLRVVMDLITTGYDRSIGRVTTSTEKAERRLKGSFGRMQGYAKTAAVGMAGVFSVDFMARLVKGGLDYAASLGEVSQQLGVTTRTLQEYRYAATQAGISQDEMDKRLAKLTRTIGEAALGGRAQSEAFNRLGISIRDSAGNIKEAGDLMPEIAEGLKRLGSEAERQATLVDLFGRSGQRLAPLMAGGAKGVNDLRKAAAELGLVLSDDVIKNADETADKISALQQVLKLKIASVVAENAEAIEALATKVVELVVALGRLAKQWRETDLRNARKDKAFGYIDSRKDLTVAQKDYAKEKFLQREAARGGVKREVTGSYLFGTIKTIRETPIKKKALAGRSRFADMEATAAAPMIGADGMLMAPMARFATAVSSGRAKEAAASIEPLAKAFTAYTAQIEDATLELDRLNAELADDKAKLAELEKREIDLRTQRQIRDIEADDKASQAEKDQLIALARQTAAAQKLAIDKEEAARIADEQKRLQDERLETAQRERDLDLAAMADRRDTLSAMADAARTAQERHAIQLRILKIDFAEEKARLETAIAAGQVKDAAEARANMEKRHALTIQKLQADYVRDLENQQVAVINSYSSVINSIASLAVSTKRGGFLGFLQGLSGVVSSLGQSGLFGLGRSGAGGSGAGGSHTLPRFAKGGSMRLDGRPGIDRNILALNGEAIAAVSRGEMMTISPVEGRMQSAAATRVQIVPSPYFNVVVDERADSRIASAAPQIAGAGSNLAQTSMIRRARKRLA